MRIQPRRCGVLARNQAMATQFAARMGAPWLDCSAFGLDHPDLRERLQFIGVSAYVLIAEHPADLLAGLLHLEAMGHGDRPVVLASADTRAARWCGSFRLGVVDVVRPDQLGEFTLRRIFLGLAERPGRVSGAASGRYLDELIDHVRAFRRSGRIESLDARGPEQAATWTWGRLTDLSRLTLDHRGVPSFAATERWVFSEVVPPSQAARAEEQRGTPRLPCDFPTVVMIGAGSRLCRAINISPGGLLVTAPELRVGTHLKLRIDFGALGLAELSGLVAHRVETPRPSVGVDLTGEPAQRTLLERVYRACERTVQRPGG
ncbi:MAG: PilZ domain-containing protein [Myxococcaceae bacterium]|nr:PilZ domain-containing protein [Myxococcaceae bacterium]